MVCFTSKIKTMQLYQQLLSIFEEQRLAQRHYMKTHHSIQFSFDTFQSICFFNSLQGINVSVTHTAGCSSTYSNRVWCFNGPRSPCQKMAFNKTSVYSQQISPDPGPSCDYTTTVVQPSTGVYQFGCCFSPNPSTQNNPCLCFLMRCLLIPRKNVLCGWN